MATLKRNANLDRVGLLTSPDYFFWGYQGSEAYFVNMNRELYARSIFCDHRIFPVNKEVIKMPLAQLLAKFEETDWPAPRVAYLFHMAHGGSTLLSRALDIHGSDIVYREPAALRQLGVSAAQLPSGARLPDVWQRVFRLSTVQLSKTYRENERALIKTNVPVNFMIPQLMSVGPGTRGLILFAGLEDYLLSVLKSPGHRSWVGNVVAELANGIASLTGVPQAALESLPDAERAAALWMAQIRLFAAALAKYPNLKSLDSEIFYGNPLQVLAKACDFYRIRARDEQLRQIVESELFTRYSKIPEQAYDNRMRLQHKEQLREPIRDELVQARTWVEKQLEKCPIPEKLPKPLTAQPTSLL